MTGEQTEKEPELRIETNCPVEDVAEFVSKTRAHDGSVRRTNFTPEQAAERINDFLAKPNAIEVILRRDGEMVGCAFSYEEAKEDLKKEVPYGKFFTKKGDRVFKVREVNVSSQYRRQGFGQMMMERIMDESRQKGATKLVLSTYPEEDDPANRLYKKLGFKEVAPNQDEHSYYMVYEYPKENNPG